MAATFTKIATVTVGSGGASTIDFSSIPATYTDLCLKVSLRCDAAGAHASSVAVNFSLNNVTTNRSFRWLEAYDGTNVWSTNNTTPRLMIMGGAATTASTFTNAEVYFPNYAGSNNKSISSDYVSEENSSSYGSLGFVAGLWSSTDAINQITISPNSGNFVQYSTATLYGIKNS